MPAHGQHLVDLARVARDNGLYRPIAPVPHPPPYAESFRRLLHPRAKPDALHDAGISFRDLRTTQSSLEDIFVSLVSERR